MAQALDPGFGVVTSAVLPAMSSQQVAIGASGFDVEQHGD
jgi:hypothetical protein